MKTLNSIINEKLIINKKIKQQGHENYLLVDWYNFRTTFCNQLSKQDINLFRDDMENDNIYIGAFIHKRSNSCRCTLYDDAPRLFEIKLNSIGSIRKNIEKIDIIEEDILKVYSYSLMYKKSISFGLQFEDKYKYLIIIISSTEEEYQQIYNIMIQDKWKFCDNDNMDQIYNCLK